MGEEEEEKILDKTSNLKSKIKNKNREISFLKSFIADEQGNFSSKRLMGVLACLVIFGITITVMLVKDIIVPPDILINSITYIALGSLGLSTADKFSKKYK